MTDPAPDPQPFRLDGFLKYVGAVGTGGEAKFRIQSGEVSVNDQTETRRRKQLTPGDIVTIGEETFEVPASSPDN